MLMGNYSGYEFDPDFNRTMVDILCLSGNSDVVQRQVNPDAPYSPTHVGIIKRFIKAGVDRETYAVYIPVSYTHLDVYKRQGSQAVLNGRRYRE